MGKEHFIATVTEKLKAILKVYCMLACKILLAIVVQVLGKFHWIHKVCKTSILFTLWNCCLALQQMDSSQVEHSSKIFVVHFFIYQIFSYLYLIIMSACIPDPRKFVTQIVHCIYDNCYSSSTFENASFNSIRQLTIKTKFYNKSVYYIGTQSIIF